MEIKNALTVTTEIYNINDSRYFRIQYWTIRQAIYIFNIRRVSFKYIFENESSIIFIQKKANIDDWKDLSPLFPKQVTPLFEVSKKKLWNIWKK